MFRIAEVIINIEALKNGISAEQLLHGPRTKTIGPARQELIRRLRAETDLSWREIGMMCGFKGRAYLSKKK